MTDKVARNRLEYHGRSPVTCWGGMAVLSCLLSFAIPCHRLTETGLGVFSRGTTGNSWYSH